MKHTFAAILLGALAVCAAPVRAESVDDIVKLAQNGIGEEVLLATVENAKGGYQLAADDVIKLKEGKVSEKVIIAMLRRRAAPVPVAPAAPAVAQPEPRPAEAPVIGPADGILTIENLDDRVWSYRYDPESKTIWIMAASSDGKGNLAGHGGLTIRMAQGTYKVRYSGQESGEAVTVAAGDKALIMLSRVETEGTEALYATIFERGERKGTSRLMTLRGGATKEARKSSDSGDVRPERIIERVVEVPSTQVVYRDYAPVVYTTPAVYSSYYYPSYSYYTPRYSSSYCGPSYYPNRYYGSHYGGHYGSSSYRPHSSFNFGYSNFGRHNSWSVGAGFRR